MNFEWDDSKNQACFDRRGFDFAYAAQVFFDPKRLMVLDDRRNYGEERYQTMGQIESRIYVVVYTLRPNSTRIISARKANRREVKYYENSTRQN